MGDRVAVMKDGVLQQCDSPLRLYDSPKNLFVAGFIGSPAMNLMSGSVVNDGIQIGDYTVPVAREVLQRAGDETSLTLGIRPEAFQPAEEGIGVHVAVVEELGADAFVYGTLEGLSPDEELQAHQIVARISSRRPPERGASIRLKVDPENIHVFSNSTQERIS